MKVDAIVLADELVIVTKHLKNLKVRDAELRKKLAEQLDDQLYDHEGYRFQRLPEKTISRINKKNLLRVLSTTGLPKETQEKIKLEAFDVEFKGAGIRMCKLK
ncbi:hypothetical protein [Ferrovum myxofaciens]|uniref:Uncharacterized protein n=1 Tax=Ferrovum myxofaciens TaxID=416213 RepID=A0A9E6SY21_9PROT|nr:hypothetical protein [Ferrovum myxofaciens]QKE37696.1 MAG: hypothetical protein HO273_02220 [Ferrovum myxofaciens]QWY75357.1 MAG: hypothetical protein JVY19_02655 [Ferrovum myxofaciens]QWY78097.1 MAG: hypothetical protein JZL65_03175 [Ferrovum myxofaciens]